MTKRQNKITISKTIEETLGDSANKLRGAVETLEYKNMWNRVSSFSSILTTSLQLEGENLYNEGRSAFMDNVAFCTARNVFLSWRKRVGSGVTL